MTSAARIMSGDILEATFDVQFEGHKFTVRRVGQRTDFAEAGGAAPFGFIRLGSPVSGAIWIGDECIGEFELVKNDVFVVTPIEQGRLLADRAETVHPVTFLLSSYLKLAHGR